ncbi:hypothetical protein [Cupriavidus campinensis]|jgi:hypothetical protein|uniref:DUF1488 domain-containing protein n=1 Tax=Cupriavidus campinensis TaxID=151783 RepID=A0ABY3EL03_9BURK|nr:hypothetical protein [Cupriavidus campinensis]TSP11463.1 hypothetical protein FGG12_17660 [Cupriavidus campinensis]
MILHHEYSGRTYPFYFDVVDDFGNKVQIEKIRSAMGQACNYRMSDLDDPDMAAAFYEGL